MADDADGDLLVCSDAFGETLDLVAAVVGRFEGDNVDVEFIEIGQRVLIEAPPRFGALGGRVAPTGVAPHLRPPTQATHLAVEGLDQELARNLLVVDPDHAVDRGLLHRITGHPASASSASSSFMAAESAMIRSRRLP